MKQSGNCGNCAKGIRIRINGDILCRIHGAVSRDHRCSRYVRKVAQWSSGVSSAGSDAMTDGSCESMDAVKCIECEYFVSPRTGKDPDPSVGYCELFTVRQYNGTTRNACSKFRKKKAENIL